MSSKLTAKQKHFVQEYLKDLNATQAAIRAGYSENSAMEQGYQLLQKTSVQSSIQKAFDKRSERTQITVDKVLRELALVGFANAADYFSWGKTITIQESCDLTREQCAVVAEVSETETKDGGTIRVKLYDKLKALEMIGRHLVMFKDTVNHTGDLNLNVKFTDFNSNDAD